MTNQRSRFVHARWGAIFVAILFAGSALAAAQSEFLVYSFPNRGTPLLHGCLPQGSLVADAAGNLYGTAASCGASNDGVVFELARPVPPKKQWTQTVLHTFTGGTDGAMPLSGVVFDAAGNLYGTANGGGPSNFGVVFELSPPATAGDLWTESVIHYFQGVVKDGANPESAGVVFDKAGNLYGVTRFGGRIDCGGGGCGVVFELSPPATSGAEWSETIIHYFHGTDGSFPIDTLTIDGKDNLYGVAGPAFRLIPPATKGGSWSYRVLYNFHGFPDTAPGGSLTLHNGRIYGLGEAGPGDLGTVFELVPPPTAGAAWTENILHSFSGGTDGQVAAPYAKLIFDKAGNLYGTTFLGGGNAVCTSVVLGCGTAFRLTPPASEGGAWTETILHVFPGTDGDGTLPSGGLLLAPNGVLFGATLAGGTNSDGTMFGGRVFGLVP